MSFASEVKKELMSVELTDKCCEKALVMGILHGGSEIVISKDGNYIIVKSYILSAIQKVMQIVKKNYDVNLVIKYGDENNNNIDKNLRKYGSFYIGLPSQLVLLGVCTLCHISIFNSMFLKSYFKTFSNSHCL